LHWTFGLLFVWIVYSNLGEGASTIEVVWNLLFVLALFVCVVLHEFGHALTARRFGVSTRDIILSPIGGIARLDRLPEKPFHEFLVAVAGPLVNFCIAIILSPYFLVFPNGDFLQSIGAGKLFADGTGFIPALILLNVVLAVFNLLPAFPMDGGRILRSLLSLRLGRVRATRIAALIGQGFAVLLAVLALWEGSMMTAFIGVFVFLTARQEYQAVQYEEMLAGYTVGSLARRQFTSLSADDSIARVAAMLRQGFEKNFLIGAPGSSEFQLLTESSIIEAIRNNHLDAPVSAYARKPEMHLLSSDSLKTAYEKFYHSKLSALPVLEDDGATLFGLLEVEAVNHFLTMERKLRRK
jgi:Zn-dependent protease